MLSESLSAKYVFYVKNSNDGDIGGIFQTLAEISLSNYRWDSTSLANAYKYTKGERPND